MAKATIQSTLFYPASQALADSAYQIDNIENLEGSFDQIMEIIQAAASGAKVVEINIRQATGDGTIPSQHPNWVTIRQRLRAPDLGYTVASNPRTGYPTISW